MNKQKEKKDNEQTNNEYTNWLFLQQVWPLV